MAAAVASVPLPPSWLGESSRFLDDAEVEKNASFVKTVFDIDEEEFIAEQLLAAKHKYTKPEDFKNREEVPFDEDSIFLDANGDALTQEDIDNESINDSDEEDIDADMDVEHSLDETAAKTLEALKNPVSVPADVASISAQICSHLRPVWKFGRGNAFDEIEKINKLLDDGYKLQPMIVRAIENIHDHMKLWYEARSSKPDRRLNAKLAAMSFIPLSGALERSGLCWKSIVDPDVKQALLYILEDGRKELNTVYREPLDAILNRKDDPCRFQVACVNSVGASVKDLVLAVQNNDRTGAQTSLDEIEGANIVLHKANEAVGFKKTDKEIPLTELKRLAQAIGKEDKQRLPIAKMYSTFFFHLFEKAGYRDVIAELEPFRGQGQMNQSFVKRIKQWENQYNEEPWKDSSVRNASVAPMTADTQKDSRAIEKASDEPVNVPAEISNGVSEPAAKSTDEVIETSVEPSGEELAQPPSRIGVQVPRRVKETTKSSTNVPDASEMTGPPSIQGVKGPKLGPNCEIDIGTVLNVQKCGFAKRVIVNTGSSKVIILKYLHGSEFSRGVLKQLEERRPFNPPKPEQIARREDFHAEAVVDFAELPYKTPSFNKDGNPRLPITKYFIRWSDDSQENPNQDLPLEEFYTTTQMRKVFGPLWTEGEFRQELEVAKKRNMEYLENCRRNGWHPDKGKDGGPITKEEMAKLPWIFASKKNS